MSVLMRVCCAIAGHPPDYQLDYEIDAYTGLLFEWQRCACGRNATVRLAGFTRQRYAEPAQLGSTRTDSRG
ncbi:MAG TPA: hypothetical protein VGB15_18135 [Longimicrobium sp.]